MVSRLESGGDGQVVDLSLRQTGELAGRVGRAPERTVGRYVARAFDRIGVPYRIRYDLPVEADAPANAAGKHEALQWWRSMLNEVGRADAGRDANLLLTAATGGGLSAVGGWAAIAPAGTLYEEFDLVDTCSPDDPRHVIYGVLHELAHCLGSSHKVPWGRAWPDHERREFHRTPEAFPDRTNACGEYVPRRPEGYARVDHLYFSECTGQQLRSQLAGMGSVRKKESGRNHGVEKPKKQPRRAGKRGPRSGRAQKTRRPKLPFDVPWFVRNLRK